MDTKVIEGTKAESAQLRWLQIAVSKDHARPMLRGLHVNGRNTVAVDGFRLHSITTPDCMIEHDGKTIEVKIPVGEFITRGEEIEGTYPDYAAIMPSNEPMLEIGLNPQFLADACKGLPKGKAVKLSFYGPNNPMEIRSVDEDGNTKYALLMPMRLD